MTDQPCVYGCGNPVNVSLIGYGYRWLSQHEYQYFHLDCEAKKIRRIKDHCEKLEADLHDLMNSLDEIKGYG